MKIIKKTASLLGISLITVAFLEIASNKNISSLEKSAKQEKLLIKKVQTTLRKKHNLYLLMTGGSATFNKGKVLYYGYDFNYTNVLSEKEVKKKFLVGLLEVLHILNSTKALQENLVVRPFTLQNLEFAIWSQVDRSDLKPDLLRLYIIRSDLGDITIEHKDLHYNPLQKKLYFADLYREFQHEIPDYLKETAQQILACPHVEKEELVKRYNYLRLNDESL